MHEIKVSSTSWHYNLYRWWASNSPWYRRHGHSYRENLCHYVRVILLWAPLLWFFSKGQVRIWKGDDDYIKPSQLTLILAMLVGEIALIWMVPPVGLAILVVIGVLIAAVLISIAFSYLHDNYKKQVEIVLMVVFFPLWFPLFVVYMTHELWHEKVWYPYVYTPLARRNRHWLARVLNGWSLSLLIAIVLGALLLEWSVQLKILATVAVIALIVVAAFIVIAGVVGCSMGIKWLWKRYVAPHKAATRRVEVDMEEPEERGPGMAKLTWIWVKEAKLGSVLCPLMKLPDPPSTLRWGGF